MDTKRKPPRKLIADNRFVYSTVKVDLHSTIQAELGAGKRGIAQDGRIRVQIPAKFVKPLEKLMNQGVTLTHSLNAALIKWFDDFPVPSQRSYGKAAKPGFPTMTQIVAVALAHWFSVDRP